MYARNFFIIFSVFLFTTSCTQETDENLYYWDETGCATIFFIADPDQNKNEQAVKDYFEALNVMVLDVKIEFISSLQQLCNGCNCTTGNRIIIEIPKSYSEKVINVGFKKL